MKNIIFDMGNVLLDYNPETVLCAYLDDEKDRAVIRQELFQGSEWIQGDLGNMTVEQRFASISRRVPEKLHGALELCMRNWHTFMPRVDGAMEFIRRAQQEGYDLYVLSNASDEFYIYFPKMYPMDWFRGVVVSADLHIIKPDSRIYQYILDMYGLKAEESLFIDDRSENIEAARKLGIGGVVFENNYDAIADRWNLW